MRNLLRNFQIGEQYSIWQRAVFNLAERSIQSTWKQYSRCHREVSGQSATGKQAERLVVLAGLWTHWGRFQASPRSFRPVWVKILLEGNEITSRGQREYCSLIGSNMAENRLLLLTWGLIASESEVFWGRKTGVLKNVNRLKIGDFAGINSSRSSLLALLCKELFPPWENFVP